MVFDEIDAGIRGRVASLVAAKLEDVARYHQVFVVTHLPQLASRAHSHLLVEKSDGEGLAAADVKGLTGDARVREIARMLGGDPESETSQDHARDLLTREAKKQRSQCGNPHRPPVSTPLQSARFIEKGY